MGMSCGIWQLADETFDDLKADASIAGEVLEELIEYDDELPEDDKIYLDLDKSWDGISFILSKKQISKHPSFLKVGGVEIKGIDHGYGPARVFNVQETRELYNAFKATNFDKARSGLTVKNFVAAETYPFNADESDQQAFEYLKPHWQALEEFLHSTASKGRCIMVYLF